MTQAVFASSPLSGLFSIFNRGTRARQDQHEALQMEARMLVFEIMPLIEEAKALAARAWTEAEAEAFARKVEYSVDIPMMRLQREAGRVGFDRLVKAIDDALWTLCNLTSMGDTMPVEAEHVDSAETVLDEAMRLLARGAGLRGLTREERDRCGQMLAAFERLFGESVGDDHELGRAMEREVTGPLRQLFRETAGKLADDGETLDAALILGDHLAGLLYHRMAEPGALANKLERFGEMLFDLATGR